MWTYSNKNGNLFRNGTLVGSGYSGIGIGLDNAEQDDVADVGPIPTGHYQIGKFFNDAGGKGPLVAHLVPDSDNSMFGRAGFMIHGDNPKLNFTASHGCIILAHSLRLQIAQSGDHDLQVV